MFGEFMAGPFRLRWLRRRDAHDVSFVRPTLGLIEQKAGGIVVLAACLLLLIGAIAGISIHS